MLINYWNSLSIQLFKYLMISLNSYNLDYKIGISVFLIRSYLLYLRVGTHETPAHKQQYFQSNRAKFGDKFAEKFAKKNVIFYATPTTTYTTNIRQFFTKFWPSSRRIQNGKLVSYSNFAFSLKKKRCVNKRIFFILDSRLLTREFSSQNFD